jgi:hypothetical protein
LSDIALGLVVDFVVGNYGLWRQSVGSLLSREQRQAKGTKLEMKPADNALISNTLRTIQATKPEQTKPKQNTRPMTELSRAGGSFSLS